MQPDLIYGFAVHVRANSKLNECTKRTVPYVLEYAFINLSIYQNINEKTDKDLKFNFSPPACTRTKIPYIYSEYFKALPLLPSALP